MKRLFFALLCGLLLPVFAWADYDGGPIPATKIQTDTTNFTNNLLGSDGNLQHDLEIIDLLVGGGNATNGTVYSVFGRTGIITAQTGDYNTTKVTEGTNLYFTNERVDDRVAALIQNGTGITWTYDDTNGTFTPTVTITQYTDALARAAFTNSVTGLDYNQTTGVWALSSGYAIPVVSDLSNLSTVISDLSNHTGDTAAHVSSGNRTDWDTAHSWGNHADAGYGTSNLTIADIIGLSNLTNYFTKTDGNSTYFQLANSISGNNITNLTWTKIDNIPANTTSDQATNTTSDMLFNSVNATNYYGITKEAKFGVYNITNTSGDSVFDTADGNYTITKVYLLCTGGTNVTGMLEKRDVNGTVINNRANATDWIANNNTALIITSFDNATYLTNETLFWNTTAQNGNPTKFIAVVEKQRIP